MATAITSALSAIPRVRSRPRSTFCSTPNVVAQREVLVDDLHPEFRRAAWTSDMDLLAVERHVETAVVAEDQSNMDR